MSLIQQQSQAVSIQYIAFPNPYGIAECVYINDRGNIKKKSLSTVFLNSISFYTFMNPIKVGTTVTSSFTYLDPSTTPTVSFSSAVYMASPFANTNTTDASGNVLYNAVLQVGSIYWSFVTKSFYGYICVLINLNDEHCPPLNTYVNCLVSGALSSVTPNAIITNINPIILTTAMQVFDPQAPPTASGFPSPYADSGVANAIRARLRGNIQISFSSGPLYTWLNYTNPNDQYFSAAYSPF